jgi:uncharacterized LabA/DUF88 family protein
MRSPGLLTKFEINALEANMSSIQHPPPRRVIVYIDGFNVYFGLRESGMKALYWLEYPSLAKSLVKTLTNAELVATKYFTSRIDSPEDKRIRQKDYIEALQHRGNIQMYFGNYRETEYTCGGCKRPNFLHNEKQTDVNIAVQMMLDAYEDNFDVAILVGGDSDLVPPIKAIHETWKPKQVIPCFPPRRISKEVTKGQIHIREADLKNNQLPAEIERSDGYVYRRPKYWK